MSSSSGITQLLSEWNKGDREALDRMLPLVYDELRRMAARRLSGERSDHTLQPTALVHEAYLRLVEQERVNWQNRAQFYGVAAEMMRRILINHAKNRKAAKRGGTAVKVSLDETEKAAEKEDLKLLALDEALDHFAVDYPRQARVVELKYFMGLSIDEIGEVLKVEHATVERDWKFAQAWLHSELSK
jgi:RNA polymerase sigma factor (TIGR02999 family)